MGTRARGPMLGVENVCATRATGGEVGTLKGANVGSGFWGESDTHLGSGGRTRTWPRSVGSASGASGRPLGDRRTDPWGEERTRTRGSEGRTLTRPRRVGAIGEERTNSHLKSEGRTRTRGTKAGRALGLGALAPPSGIEGPTPARGRKDERAARTCRTQRAKVVRALGLEALAPSGSEGRPHTRERRSHANSPLGALAPPSGAKDGRALGVGGSAGRRARVIGSKDRSARWESEVGARM
jgi:hypothetical protein